jgi:hypothetical protein
MRVASGLLCAALAISAGCRHVTNDIPGVLDMRTDGSGAPANTAVSPSAARTGFDALMQGNGVTGTSDITIEDRTHFVLSYVPILNDRGSTPEWNTALGDGALTNIVIKDQYALITWGVSFLKNLIPVVGSFIAGTADHTVTARRVRVNGAASSTTPTDTPPTPIDSSVGY